MSNLFPTVRWYADEGAIMPECRPDRAHTWDAGLDLKSPICVDIPPQTSCAIDTGIHIEIPRGYAGMLIAKSGLNVKHNVLSTGLIDSGYQGSIVVNLYNHDPNKCMTILPGDKISQLVIIPVVIPNLVECDGFEIKTERGSNGFGSSGR